MAINFFNLHAHYSAKNNDETAIISFSVAEKDKISDGLEAFSIGLHPWFIDEKTLSKDLKEIANFAEKSNCVAIGECGLCRLKGPELAVQAKVFSQQIEIANLAEKPMIIHCVRAFPELLAIKNEYHKATPWIIHGYHGNREITRQLLKHNIYLSFGENRTPGKIAEILPEIPIERLFIETDESHTPIADLYQQVADIKNIPVEELKEKLIGNAKTLNLIAKSLL